MDTIQIKNKLEQLAEFKAQKDIASLDMQALIDAIYTPEIKAQIKEIEEEFAYQTQAVDENIKLLEDEIREAVIEHGESVKGSAFHAVYMKGRVSWDGKFLDGYAVDHPELLHWRKEGNPTVSIRASK